MTETMSIEGIVSTIIGDASSPIVSWLTNVLETYLSNTQQSVALTTNILHDLTHEMLANYSFNDPRDLCTKLMESLEANGHIAPFTEPFPVHTQCLALFLDDS